MRKICNITDGRERAFYASKDTEFENITIDGIEDGESAFKECSNISVFNSQFKLRYPFWHNNKLVIDSCNFADTCRASFWYVDGLKMTNCISDGIKAFRECKNIEINNSKFVSEEFGWRCHNIQSENLDLTGSYAFFECNDVKLSNFHLNGKYSFQYINNLVIEDSNLDTKDAFWHTKNVTIKNSVIKGEYLAWYSENITFINCKIIGTQPLCYVKNLKLIDCEFIDCDLAFEYSEVNGNIKGSLLSIKNPLSGEIIIDEIPTMIIDENDKSEGHFSIKKS